MARATKQKANAPAPAASQASTVTRLPTARMALSELLEDDANARKHSPRNLAAITSSLEKFGQVEPLVVHEKTKRVIGGNGRLTAMRALGWTEAEVVQVQCTDRQAKALGLALNRTAELAEWDFGQLENLLKEALLEMPGDDLGFSKAELDALLLSNPFEGVKLDGLDTTGGKEKGDDSGANAGGVVKLTAVEQEAGLRILVACLDADVMQEVLQVLAPMVSENGVLSVREC